MPTNKFYHILCTSGDKVVYEGRFQCVSRSAAMKLLREKVGRQNLFGLIYTVTEIPIEVLREIVDALINKKPITEGDICSYKETPTISPTYAKINSYKHNPNKPQGVNGVKRRLRDF